MAVGIDKAMRIHEAQILRFVVGRAARSQRLGNQVIDLIATLATQADQDLDRLARIADVLGREITKAGVRKQHDKDRVTDDDARARVVGELRIVGKAECLEERQ